jgi:hypothetical protein
LSPYWRPDTTENRLQLLRGLAGGGTIHVHDRDHGPLLNRLIDEDLILPVAHYKTAVDCTSKGFGSTAAGASSADRERAKRCDAHDTYRARMGIAHRAQCMYDGYAMARMNISIPDPLYERLDRLRDRVNASKVCASALEAVMHFQS